MDLIITIFKGASILFVGLLAAWGFVDLAVTHPKTSAMIFFISVFLFLSWFLGVLIEGN